MRSNRLIAPFVLPLLAFAAAIILGSLALYWPGCAAGEPIAWVDALFMATSSVCVTGLGTLDPNAAFNQTGQIVLMALMQLGGIGIVTYSSLILYMLKRKVSLNDRLAVGQALLYDASFHLGSFLQRIVVIVFSVELVGASLLVMMEPEKIGWFKALFLAVSSFCNCGFALWPDNLIVWQDHWGVNLVVMSLISIGGFGFAVVDECLRLGWAFIKRSRQEQGRLRLGYASRLVLRTSMALTLGGALLLYISESLNPHSGETMIITSLFQSVTSRTAGFCTLDIGRLTDLSLMIIIILMFIGASPGSCGGGIKTTSFRVLCSFAWAQIRGSSQVVVQGRAVSLEIVKRAAVLFMFSITIILLATFLLIFTENSGYAHHNAPLSGMDIFFEVVSAFATVGLSTGITAKFSFLGKIVLCCVMYIGRLGPIWFITTLQRFSVDRKYRYPETELPIG